MAFTRPTAGFTTRRPEEPYTTSVRTVLWEPGRATAPATRAMVAARPLPQGLVSVLSLFVTLTRACHCS
jgi:hypothetical protein